MKLFAVLFAAIAAASCAPDAGAARVPASAASAHVATAAPQPSLPPLLEGEARAMTDRAFALIKSMGLDEVIMRINARDQLFVNAKLTMSIRDLYTGIVIVHPLGASHTGSDNPGNDARLRDHPRQVIEHAKYKGSGIVGQSWIRRAGDVVLEVTVPAA